MVSVGRTLGTMQAGQEFGRDPQFITEMRGIGVIEEAQATEAGVIVVQLGHNPDADLGQWLAIGSHGF